MLHKIIVCCLVVVALAFPARASSLWHPEPGFLPEDARHAVPNNPPAGTHGSRTGSSASSGSR
ncbi:MAG: hypothetical protein ACLSHC_16360 [Bilophila wadsworthia]